MVRFIKKEKIDLIHSHLFGTNLYSAISGRLCGIPVMSTFHGTVDINKKDRNLKLKFFIVNKFSSSIIYVSKTLLQYYSSYNLVDILKSKVIYNGIDTNRFRKDRKFTRKFNIRKEFRVSNDDIIVGSVGDLRPVKGYDILIEAAKRLKEDNYNNIKFFISGSVTSHFEYYQTMLAKYDLDGRVFFIGHLKNIPEFLDQIDIYLLPSITEGFSLSTVEAMAMELPVIVTKSGGPEEIVKNKKNGILINTNSSIDIVNSIRLLLKNDKLSGEISLNARQEVINRFSIQKMIKQYMILYDELLSKKR
jgi:glycosyltransferase involved in cell wall biosynthesis